jgi:hypothetical protein
VKPDDSEMTKERLAAAYKVTEQLTDTLFALYTLPIVRQCDSLSIHRLRKELRGTVAIRTRRKGYWIEQEDREKINKTIGKNTTRCSYCGFSCRIGHPGAPRFGVPPEYPEDGECIYCGWCGVKDVVER